MTKIFDAIKQKIALIPDPTRILEAAEKWGFGEKSKELLKRALEVESLGAMPFSMYEAPPIIEKAGDGALVYDADGRKYIDMIAGFAVSNVGHHRPEVLEAIVQQFKKIVQYAEMLSEVRIKLGEKLVSITPGDFPKKVFYTVTGSDANEVAIKLARYYTGRTIIMTQWGDYHGRTIGTAPLTHSFSTWAQIYPVPPADTGIVRFPFPYCYRCPCNPRADDCRECAEYCLYMVDYMLSSRYYGLYDSSRGVSNVAAMLIEPYQSAAGYMIPPDNWLPELYKIAREHDILFIPDEIQTGWARTGKMWAIQHYPEIEPDIFLVAKSIADGLPFAAIIGRREIMDSWGPGAHSTTFAGYMLGCAAALATIEIFEKENLAREAERKGKYFIKGLKDLAEEHPIVGYVEGKGLYIGIEFVKDRRTKKPATKETKWMSMKLMQLGMLVKRAGYYGNRFALSPPLTITFEQIDKALEIFDKAFKYTEEEFGIKQLSNA